MANLSPDVTGGTQHHIIAIIITYLADIQPTKILINIIITPKMFHES